MTIEIKELGSDKKVLKDFLNCVRTIYAGNPHYVRPLDFDEMAIAAREFCGEHDFSSFSANRGTPETNTVRTIRAVHLRRSGPCISMEFDGDGFLYKMVRMMAGTLVRIGLGQASPQETAARFRSPRKTISRGRTAAPADGLFLIRVRY